MECKRENKDLISLNQKLMTGKNSNSCIKPKHQDNEEKSGWKAFDTKKDNLKHHLVSQSVVRKNKNVLDFDKKAVNPVVYPNFNSKELDISGAQSKENFTKPDEILGNINRDAVLDDYQLGKQEDLVPSHEKQKENENFFEPGKQKYIIAQVRNYLPLVKNIAIRGRLELLLKYLHNTSSAQELTINNKGNFQKGLFDTQTKFSEYLNYYVLSEEEKRGIKKPPFYAVLIEEPLKEYSQSTKQVKVENAVPGTVKNEPLEYAEEKEAYDQLEKGITPLRNIKDSDLQLQTSLPKIAAILANLNIGITENFDNKATYDNIINIIAFPIYAAKAQKGESPKKNEYSKFCRMLKEYLYK